MLEEEASKNAAGRRRWRSHAILIVVLLAGVVVGLGGDRVRHGGKELTYPLDVKFLIYRLGLLGGCLV